MLDDLVIDTDEEDVTGFMGFKGRRGMVRVSPRRRRHVERSRSRSRRVSGVRAPPPWREEQHTTPASSARVIPEADASINSSQVVREAMSMARHTWRNVLCMADDGPSTDLRQILDEPLDRAQVDNIGATIETMDSVERMTFMTAVPHGDLSTGLLHNADHPITGTSTALSS